MNLLLVAFLGGISVWLPLGIGLGLFVRRFEHHELPVVVSGPGRAPVTPGHTGAHRVGGVRSGSLGGAA